MKIGKRARRNTIPNYFNLRKKLKPVREKINLSSSFPIFGILGGMKASNVRISLPLKNLFHLFCLKKRCHCEEAKPTKQSKNTDCRAPPGLAMPEMLRKMHSSAWPLQLVGRG